MITDNELSSDFFYLTRGVKQGNPLSPYLFLLAAGTLAIVIREKEEIKGVAINQVESQLKTFSSC